MRIAMVSAPTDLPTAQEREVAGHAGRLADALAGQGHDVVVYARRVDEAAPATEVLASGVTVRQVAAGPVDAVLSAALSDFGRALAQEWRERVPDVVHAYSWTSGLAVASARQQLRESAVAAGGVSVPVVLTFTGFGVHLRRGAPDDPALASRIRLESALARSVDAVVVGSDDEAGELLRMGVPRERVAAVPAGIDVERFTPEGPVADRTDDPRLIAIGDLTPSSGFETTIAALRHVPGAELLILGNGPDLQELTRLRAGAARLGVGDRVTFLDHADDDLRPALLRSADAVIYVPWFGPASAGPLLEAMACGVPVVVTAVGAVADVVVDGMNGVHVPPRRPDRLATAIRGLLGDPVRRLGFGVAGSDRAHSRYEWARVAEGVERVYARLVPAGEVTTRPEDHSLL